MRSSFMLDEVNEWVNLIALKHAMVMPPTRFLYSLYAQPTANPPYSTYVTVECNDAMVTQIQEARAKLPLDELRQRIRQFDQGELLCDPGSVGVDWCLVAKHMLSDQKGDFSWKAWPIAVEAGVKNKDREEAEFAPAAEKLVETLNVKWSSMKEGTLYCLHSNAGFVDFVERQGQRLVCFQATVSPEHAKPLSALEATLKDRLDLPGALEDVGPGKAVEGLDVYFTIVPKLKQAYSSPQPPSFFLTGTTTSDETKAALETVRFFGLAPDSLERHHRER